MNNQCRSSNFMKNLRCQGCRGHDGPHWAYDAHGSLIRWKNKKDKDPKWKKIASEWIPPGHEKWVSPVEMYQFYYIHIYAEKTRQKKDSKSKKTRK